MTPEGKGQAARLGITWPGNYSQALRLNFKSPCEWKPSDTLCPAVLKSLRTQQTEGRVLAQTLNSLPTNTLAITKNKTQ